ncbi:MAG: hypothetical protein GF387_02600 [Candidatus Portnoybacteria bacterium]|nr:hypothetical protein [Candidatus Portnoybacteria bacterium]
MVFTPHIIVGAAIGARIKNFGLVIVIALISHLALDKLYHWDYPIPGIEYFQKHKNLKKVIFDFIKIGIDGLIGLIILLPALYAGGFFDLNAEQLPFIATGIFFSILPDIVLGFVFLLKKGKGLNKYLSLHENYLHFDHKNKIRFDLKGVLTQIIVIILALFLII